MKHQLCVQDIQHNPVLLKGDGDKSSAAKMAGLEDAGKDDKKEQRRKKATGSLRQLIALQFFFTRAAFAVGLATL